MEILMIKQKKELFFTVLRLPLLQAFCASCFIGICAQISIPLYFTPVPLTGQTFGVILIGVLLGKRTGALAALFYLMQGAAGLPVFAGGKAGVQIFFGATAGYLLAYPLQAYLIGWALETYQTRLARICWIFLISLMQLGLGSLWLAGFVGFKLALPLGFYPFITGELAKVLFIVGFKNRR